MNSSTKGSRNILIGLALLGALGMGLALLHTRIGPGTGGDSTSYLMGAENLAAGRGFFRYSGGYELRPISGFPPFYSFVLAGFNLVGFPLLGLARYLNALLYGLNGLLVGWLVYRRAQNGLLALLAAGLFLAADSIFTWHTWVMSEPLYLFLFLVGTGAFLAHFDGARRRALALAGVLYGLATLTRYIGISAVAAGAVVLLAVDWRTWRDRLLDALAFSGSSAVIVGGWLLRNARVAGTATNRELRFHGVDLDLLRLYLAEIGSWLVPHELPLPTAVRAGLAVLITAGFVGAIIYAAFRKDLLRWSLVAIRRKPGARYSELPWFLLLYLLAFAAVLAANSLFLDASTSSSAVPRYLVPAFTGLLILFVGEVGRVALGSKLAWRRLALVMYALVLLAFYAYNTAQIVAAPLRHLGYTGDRHAWRQLTGAIQSVEPNRVILSNNPQLVYILSGRPAYVRPIRFDHYQEEFREDFEHQLEATKEKMQRGALLVIFRPVEEIDRTVIEYTGAVELESFPQGVFYALPGS